MQIIIIVLLVPMWEHCPVECQYRFAYEGPDGEFGDFSFVKNGGKKSSSSSSTDAARRIASSAASAAVASGGVGGDGGGKGLGGQLALPPGLDADEVLGKGWTALWDQNPFVEIEIETGGSDEGSGVVPAALGINDNKMKITGDLDTDASDLDAAVAEALAVHTKPSASASASASAVDMDAEGFVKNMIEDDVEIRDIVREATEAVLVQRNKGALGLPTKSSEEIAREAALLLSGNARTPEVAKWWTGTAGGTRNFGTGSSAVRSLGVVANAGGENADKFLRGSSVAATEKQPQTPAATAASGISTAPINTAVAILTTGQNSEAIHAEERNGGAGYDFSSQDPLVQALMRADPRLQNDPLYANPVAMRGYIDEREFLYLMNNFMICEDSVTFRDAYGYPCAAWNGRCSRMDPPVATSGVKVLQLTAYTWGQIKEVHLFCKATCGMCVQQNI